MYQAPYPEMPAVFATTIVTRLKCGPCFTPCADVLDLFFLVYNLDKTNEDLPGRITLLCSCRDLSLYMRDASMNKHWMNGSWESQ